MGIRQDVLAAMEAGARVRIEEGDVAHVSKVPRDSDHRVRHQRHPEVIALTGVKLESLITSGNASQSDTCP